MLGVYRFNASPRNDQSIRQFIEEYKYNIYLTLYAMSKLSEPPLKAMDSGINTGGHWNINIPHLTRFLLGERSIDYQRTWNLLLSADFLPPGGKQIYTKAGEHVTWSHPRFNGLVSIIECVNYPVWGGFTVATYSLLKDMNPQIQDEIRTYLSEGNTLSRTMALDEFLAWTISQKNNPLAGTIAQMLNSPLIIDPGQGVHEALSFVDNEIFSSGSRVSSLRSFFKLYDWIDKMDGYRKLLDSATYLKSLGYYLRAGTLDRTTNNIVWLIIAWSSDKNVAVFTIKRNDTYHWIIHMG
jgi:hypothetical protein